MLLAICPQHCMTVFLNEAAPTRFCSSKSLRRMSSPCRLATSPKFWRSTLRTSSISECITLPSALMTYEASTSIENRKLFRCPWLARAVACCRALPKAFSNVPCVSGVFTESSMESNMPPNKIPSKAPSGPAVINPRNPPIHLPIAIFLLTSYF